MDRLVGEDGEPIGVTQIRAALAVLADDPDRVAAVRNARFDQLTDELLAHEKQRWAATSADSRWSLDGLATEAQEEALIEVVSGANVILSTPTGSGKSLVAAGALFAALGKEQVGFYTAPI